MKTKLRKRRKGHEKMLTEAPQNIIRLEASINYTNFILQTGKIQIMSYYVSMYGVLLPQTFIRVNKSCIINKSFIKNLNVEDKVVTLKDGYEVQISRRRWAEVLLNVA